jgi:hypothetical protein
MGVFCTNAIRGSSSIAGCTELSAFHRVTAAMSSTTSMPGSTTRPNTVKPSFCVSRKAGAPPLSRRLMNHWLVALFT